MSSSERRPTLLLAGLGLWVLLAALALATSGPPRALGPDAPPERFSSARAFAVLEGLVGEGLPHPTGSADAVRVRGVVVDALRSAGYEPVVRDAFACSVWGRCARVHNVLARLPGRERGPALLLASHYDSAPSGPGASDDGMGTAALLEIARALRSEAPLRRDVIFLIDEAEEYGLIGATAFAESDPWMRDVGAVINLEARGSAGPSLMFETSPGNIELIARFARAVERPRTSSLFSTIYRQLPNDTDLTIFMKHGLPGLNFANVRFVEHYHTPRDDLARANRDTLQHHGDNALALARSLAESELPLESGSDAVFFDVFGRTLLWWPAPWTLPAALTVAAGLVLFAASGVRSGELAVRGLSISALAWPAALATAALAAQGLVSGLQLATGVTSPWTAHPLPTRAALWLIGAAPALAAGSLLALRARPAERWAGAALWPAALSIGLAATLPGVAYLFLVPLAAGVAVALAARALRRSRTASVRAASLASLCAAGALWLPLARLLEDALGFGLGAGIGAAVALAGLELLALGERRALRAAGALAGGALGATLLQLALPSYSAEHPQHVTLVLEQEPQAGNSTWHALARNAPLPAALGEEQDFAASHETPPWVLGYPVAHAYRAKSDLTPGPGPELSLLEDRAVSAGRRVRVRLRSLRQAPVLQLWIPPGFDVIAAELGGVPLPAPLPRMRERLRGWSSFELVTTPPEGFELVLEMRGTGRVEAVVVDCVYGLPGAATPLREARPDHAVPVFGGDAHLVVRRIIF